MTDYPEKREGSLSADCCDGEAAGRASRRTTAIKWVLVVAILAASVVVTVLIRSHRSTADAGPGLMVSEQALDVGAVWMQKDYRLMLPITNTTGSPIEVSKLASSCRCTSTTEALVVPPGVTGELSLSVNLVAIASRQGDDAESSFSIPVMPIVKSTPLDPPVWVIKGRARRILRKAPTHIDFGELPLHAEGRPVRTVEMLAVHPLSGVRVECDQAPHACRVRWSAQTPAAFSLEVKPAGSLPMGRFEFSARVFVSVDGAVEFCAAEIPVFGNVVGDVEANPSMLLLGAVKLEEPVEQTIWLRARSGKSCKVKAEETDGVRVVPRQLELDGERAVRLQIIPKPGTQDATISFLVQRAGRQSVIKIPLKYVGIDRQ